MLVAGSRATTPCLFRFMMQYFGGRLLKNETVTMMEQDHMPARRRCHTQHLLSFAVLCFGHEESAAETLEFKSLKP